MQILYVEDNSFDADLTRRALLKTAPLFTLDIARTQTEALEALQQKTDYDLLLTDLRLPDGSGFALLSYVREQGLPLGVVVITGQGDEEIAVSVLKAGADDYIVKRQDYLEHLALTLENVAQRHRAEIARRERALRVLYLENNPSDIDLTRHHFASHAPHIHLKIVHTEAQVFKQLPGGKNLLEFDALMLDFLWQDLNALDLLKELRQVRGLDLPIIFVTGHGDEELAAQVLRLGASDYVVKSPGYLFRLPGLLENAYHRAQLLREQAALRHSEERFRRLAENAPDVISRFRIAPAFSVEYISPAIMELTGYTPEEFYRNPDLMVEAIHLDDQPLFLDLIQGKSSLANPATFHFIRKDGSSLWLETRSVPVLDNENNLVAIEAIFRDVTERKEAEEHIQRQIQRLNALRTVDTAISASLDLKYTLNVLLEHVVSRLAVHAATILLFNPKTQLLEYSAGTGFRSRAIETISLRLGDGYAGKAALSRSTLHIPDRAVLKDGNGFSDLLASEGFVAYYGTPLVAKGEVKGVLEIYHRGALNPDPEWLSFFETLAGQAAIAIDNAELFENLQHANLDLTQAYDTTLEGWVRALDLRDRETQGHTQRVTEMTVQLARSMRVSESSLLNLRRGALLHDIGKMGIPDSILHKPGPLTTEEWKIMRMHPVYAYDLLAPIDYLRPTLEIPYCHHERWDGSGYPHGTQGEQIPLAARLFTVVDVWDALSSDRSYRQRWQPDQVYNYIRSQSGLHFDPMIVEKFLQLIS